MLKKNKTNKPRVPTVDEFLAYKPKRLDFAWEVKADGLVEIIVPKFNSNFGKSFCKITRKEETFVAKMDKIGTLVWQNCDGMQSVEKILNKLKKEFPDEANIDQRLFSFLQQMQSLNYIEL